MVYKSGAENPAYYLFRHPPSVCEKQEKMTEYANFIVHKSAPKAMAHIAYRLLQAMAHIAYRLLQAMANIA